MAGRILEATAWSFAGAAALRRGGKGRWFNPRHFALVALVAALLLLVDKSELLPDEFFEIALGMLFGAFGLICGRHLTNLLLFRYLNENPQEVSGQVRLSMKLMLKMSQFTYVGLAPLFLTVATLVPDRYTWGVFLGLLAVVAAHAAWAHKSLPRALPQEGAGIAQGSGPVKEP